MIARISFYAEVFVRGENLEEIKRKFEDMQLFSEEAMEVDADFVEYVNITTETPDGDIKDISQKYYEI